MAVQNAEVVAEILNIMFIGNAIFVGLNLMKNLILKVITSVWIFAENVTKVRADMAKNNQMIKLLKFYQEKEKMLIPEMYASFGLALLEKGVDKEEVKEIFELTQAFWEYTAEHKMNLVKWAEEKLDMDLHTFDTGKAKISKE